MHQQSQSLKAVYMCGSVTQYEVTISEAKPRFTDFEVSIKQTRAFPV